MVFMTYTGTLVLFQVKCDRHLFCFSEEQPKEVISRLCRQARWLFSFQKQILVIQTQGAGHSF